MACGLAHLRRLIELLQATVGDEAKVGRNETRGKTAENQRVSRDRQDVSDIDPLFFQSLFPFNTQYRKNRVNKSNKGFRIGVFFN